MAIDEPLITTAARLLEQWAPTRRIQVVGASAPPLLDEDWESAPSPAKVGEYCRFPADRFPVAAELLEFEEGLGYFDGQRASAGRPDAAAAYVITALTEALEAGSCPLDQRARPLAGFLGRGEDAATRLRPALAAGVHR
ncbi:hypothetical protein ABZ897_61260 [Nonomuraea sp. NPDC046802]|uniref:hypothetical protein n=1 Tax=Nonomuraea sp. NPDC046802 TaxID=3154919 RepID=UPI0033F20D62